MNIKYIVANPTGNITALVTTCVPKDQRPLVGSCIMEKDSSIEQVGFIELSEVSSDSSISFDIKSPLVSLNMAGGEFCGNATMSTAALCVSGLLDQEFFGLKYSKYLPKLEPGKEMEVLINSSGSKVNPLEVHVKNDSSYSECNTELYTGKLDLLKDEMAPNIAISGDSGVVFLSGITHMIVPSGICSDKEAEETVKEKQDSLQSEAMGLLQIDPPIYSEGCISVNMRPLVYVPESGTLVWENGCASGSASLALFLAKKKLMASENKENTTLVKVSQPGGVIDVFVTFKNFGTKEETVSISILGHVRFISTKECLCPYIV